MVLAGGQADEKTYRRKTPYRYCSVYEQVPGEIVLTLSRRRHVEDTNKQRLRPNENAGNLGDYRQGDAVEVPERESDADFRKRIELAISEAEARKLAEPVESEQERDTRERRELIETADDTEIIDGGISTAAYRRAVAVFDPEDDRLQLAEHYHFRSATYERNGRF